MSSQPYAAPGQAPAAQMLQLATGYWMSRAVHVAARLGIADLIKTGPKSVVDLAAATGTNPDALYRLLRALASAGVFVESTPRRFGHTPLSRTLRSDACDSMRASVLFFGDEAHWTTYGEMMHSVQTGKPAADKLDENREDALSFDDAMSSQSAADTAIADAYDFSAFARVMDIGGGDGGLLAAILGKYSQTRGILFDSPDMIARAGEKAILNGHRSEMIAGDFLENIPGRADAYVMKNVIHACDDDAALRILENCRSVMAGSNRLLVMEMPIHPGNEPSFAKLLDLEMLLLAGGRERTISEYRALLASAHLRLTRVVPTYSMLSILEASPM